MQCITMNTLSFFKLRPIVICISVALTYSQESYAEEDVVNTAGGTIELEEIIVKGQGESRSEIGKDNVYDKDIVNIYQSKEEIENYKGTSAGDLLKGMNGVYAGDSRNSGALDVNIRGLQGEGRVPVTVDGTLQSTTNWMAAAGLANRSYVDPNMISSIMVEKGPNATSADSGIGGSVQIKTLEAADIVKPGEIYGVEFKAETGTNSTPANESAFGAFGQDYHDIYGAYGEHFGYSEVVLPSSMVTKREAKESHSGTDLDFDDNAYRLAIATKQELFELLAAYSYRSRGNYYSGKENSSDYQTDTWVEDSQADRNNGYNYPSVNYIAKYFKPGEEVLNTSSELESTLLKGKLRLPDNQEISLGYQHSDHTYGETRPYDVVTGIQYGFTYQYENPYSEVAQDTWNLGYTWNSKDNALVNLTAGLWMTQSDARRHQNGDSIYALGSGAFAAGRDDDWDNYVKCYIAGNPKGQDCSKVPNVAPEKPSNDDGQYTVAARALQITDHHREGFNLSNVMVLNPTLDLTLSGDWTKEVLKQWDVSKDQQQSDLTWGVNSMGPRSGSREQWNLGFNFDWRATPWLQVNAGARYSDYQSFDDGLAENRANQEEDWAVRDSQITSRRYYYQELMTEEQVNATYDEYSAYYGDDFLAEYPDVNTFIKNYGDTYNAKQVNGFMYSKRDTSNSSTSYVEMPYDGTHNDFADNNPFLNGTEDLGDRIIESAHSSYAASAETAEQGGESAPARIYNPITDMYTTTDLTDAEKWAKPEKVRDHAWVPNLGVTAFVTDNVRLYARYNEAIRFPTVYESSMALAGVSKAPTTTVTGPEHAYNWEVGYAHNLSSYFDSLKYADFRINYFNNRIEDYIDRNDDWAITQFDEKKLSGIEVQTRFDSGRYFMNVAGTYRLEQQLCDRDYASWLAPTGGKTISTCVDGGFPQTGARTSLQPEYSINLDLGARLLERKLEIGGRAVYHSEADNKSEASFGDIGWGITRAYYWNPVLVFDAYGSYQLHENVSMDFGITNLTNQYYLDPMARVTLPAPGRTIRMGLAAKF